MNCLGDGEIQIEKCPGNRIFFFFGLTVKESEKTFTRPKCFLPQTINASRATQNKPNNSNPWVTGKGQILLIPSHHKKPEKPKPKPKQMHNVCCQIRPLCWNQTTIKSGKRKRERKGSPIPAPRKTAENEAHFMGIAKRWVMFYGSKTPKTKQRYELQH